MFSTQQITTRKVRFGHCRMVPLVALSMRTAISVASGLLSCFAFFLHSRTSLAHLLNCILTHCHRIHSPLSKISQCSPVMKVTRTLATAVFQFRGPSCSCFKQFCPRIIDWWVFSSNQATHTFFHLLKVLKFGCPIHVANCFKENSVCFKLSRNIPPALPKSNKLSLSSSAWNWW